MSFLPFVLLASSSPRRRQLLQQIGVRFEIAHPNVDETLLPNEAPVDHVTRLALAKARAVTTERSDGVILGSDTTVVLDGEILAKPLDSDDARRMLRKLSGRTHTVYTGYAIVDMATDTDIVGYESTHVSFRDLEDEEIDRYVRGGSPMDKAGSYGIQDDFGAVFIERIDGDYYTVVGLPLCRVYQDLRRFARGDV